MSSLVRNTHSCRLQRHVGKTGPLHRQQDRPKAGIGQPGRGFHTHKGPMVAIGLNVNSALGGPIHFISLAFDEFDKHRRAPLGQRLL